VLSANCSLRSGIFVVLRQTSVRPFPCFCFCSQGLLSNLWHRWTFGANRVQLDVDIKLLNEFLEALHADSLRADHDVTSLDIPRPLGGLLTYQPCRQKINCHISQRMMRIDSNKVNSCASLSRMKLVACLFGPILATNRIAVRTIMLGTP
jgi:hypothetical protein